MRIMVVGARGMLGTDLMESFAAFNPLGFDLPEMDITDPSLCRDRVRDARPEVILHSAALTNVDACELDPEEAFRVNGQGTANLAAAAQAAGARLVYYSTDYLFDGASPGGYREDDAPNPLSAYGKSKRMGEDAVRSYGADHLILRTSWLFGCHGKNFIRTIVGVAREGTPLRIVDDQRGSPTYTKDIAARTLALVSAGCRGTYHVTNSGSCTWYELACSSVEWAGIANARITPVRTHEFPRPAPRPACSILLQTRTLPDRLPPMRPWQEAARSYVTTCLNCR
jgi:dTDP-4-dehydrorhamnose reductase